jgi:hypothetical protein
MARTSCDREDDVLALVTSGRWTSRMADDLRAHAAGCPVCAELALVAEAIDGETNMAMARADVPALPSSGTVWWRAQLRARQDAVRESGRPITVAHGMLLAVAGGLAGAIFGATTDWFQRGLRAGRDAAASVLSGIHLPAALTATPDAGYALTTFGATLAVAGVLFVAATVIVVWALREDRELE